MSVSTLCQTCGMCCDGTIFGSVPLGDGPSPLPGLEVLRQGVRALPQPCQALEGTRCSRYEDRPEACRRFICLLAAAVDDGELELEEALTTVWQTQKRRDAVSDSVGLSGGAGVREAVRQGEEASEETQEALRKLEALIGRYFLGRSAARR